jgi:hypothetical protein
MVIATTWSVSTSSPTVDAKQRHERRCWKISATREMKIPVNAYRR